MIKTIVFTSFLFSYLSSVSQEVIFSKQRGNKFYPGIDNPLQAMVEGYPCASVILSTDNGSIEKRSCYFTFRPARMGSAKIEFRIKTGKTTRKIKEILFPIDSIPPPIAYVGGLRGGAMRKEAFAAQEGVGARPEPSLGFELTYTVTNFITIIIRNDSIVFNRKTVGNRFINETREAINGLQNNDIILFTKIICKVAEGRFMYVRPLEFLIIE